MYDKHSPKAPQIASSGIACYKVAHCRNSRQHICVVVGKDQEVLLRNLTSHFALRNLLLLSDSSSDIRGDLSKARFLFEGPNFILLLTTVSLLLSNDHGVVI
jgi:hypothetical protein